VAIPGKNSAILTTNQNIFTSPAGEVDFEPYPLAHPSSKGRGNFAIVVEVTVPHERFQFTGSEGHQLAAALDTPDGAIQAYALFAHCFTCGKDVLAAKRIAVALAAKGIAVLRFDFTGLGSSEGDFANSTFSSNVADLVRAADHLRETRKAPAILIGHSLGGAAILAAAGHIPDAKAVVTIAAPSDPAHVTNFFKARIEDIRTQGKVEVSLAGRPFHIKREFLDDIAEHSLMARVAKLRKGLLIMHSPTDDTVSIDNATKIFIAARHPKSFVSLADADHLLTGKRDAAYVADVIAAWAERYIDPVTMEPAADLGEAPRNVVVRETRNSKFQQTIAVGPHRMLADEPVAAGGEDSGPGPYDFVLAGLGACTSMTMRLYADRKSLPLERTTVTLMHSKIHAEDCAECETREGTLDQIERVIAMEGPLDAEQRKKLMEIADKCPVHRTLTSEIHIVTKAAD
jgi:putative redox protein